MIRQIRKRAKAGSDWTRIVEKATNLLLGLLLLGVASKPEEGGIDCLQSEGSENTATRKRTATLESGEEDDEPFAQRRKSSVNTTPLHVKEEKSPPVPHIIPNVCITLSPSDLLLILLTSTRHSESHFCPNPPTIKYQPSHEAAFADVPEAQRNLQ